VATGQAALEALRRRPYDLVLMDVRMPEMDGIEATRAVRAGGAGVHNRRIPIIAMTANAMASDREDCLAAGMDDYLAKPVRTKDLLRLIDRWRAKLYPAGSAGATAHESPAPTEDASENEVQDEAMESAASQPPGDLFEQSVLLAKLQGDLDVAKVVVRVFLQTVPRQLEAMTNAARSHDSQTIQFQAHSMKGAAATVGGGGLARLASAVEQACKADDWQAIDTTLKQLLAQFDRMKQVMEAFDPSPGIGVA